MTDCTWFNWLSRFHFFDLTLRIGQRRYNGHHDGLCATTALKDPPNLIRSGPLSLDRLLSHTNPGAAEESEDFVSRI